MDQAPGDRKGDTERRPDSATGPRACVREDRPDTATGPLLVAGIGGGALFGNGTY